MLKPYPKPYPKPLETIMRMTDVGIRKLKPRAERYEEWEDGRTGLGVRVTPKGRKSFVFMYWRDGKARRMTLGVYGKGPGKISLSDANLRRAEARKALDEGRDPGADTVEANRAERDAETVADLAEMYLVKWARPNKRSADADERILRKELIPSLGRRKAKDIVRRDIIELLDGIVERGSPVMANRVLTCVRRVFSWAVERDILGASPCVSIKAPAREKPRDRTLSDSEIHTFWRGLDNARITEGVRLALKFLLVTAQRRGEVAAAEWTEFDRDAGVWTIPAIKVKNSVRHVVPLAPQALDLLDAIEAISPEAEADALPSRFLFPSPVGDKPVAAEAVSHALKKNLDHIGVENVTPHDLRRTATTAMAAMGVDRTVLEKVLNHADGGVIGRYDTHSYIPEKRAALERWGRRLQEIISGKPTYTTVVELRGRSQ